MRVKRTRLRRGRLDQRLMSDKNRSSFLLWTGFARSCECVPERPAIDVGREVTYRELDQRAKRLAATLQSEVVNDGVPLTAVFAFGRKQHMRRYWGH